MKNGACQSCLGIGIVLIYDLIRLFCISVYIMNTHSQDAESIFCCRSTFTPKPALLDTVVEQKKPKEIEYLPGEKLLISLKKQKEKTPKVPKAPRNRDIERITKSMSRVLTRF